MIPPMKRKVQIIVTASMLILVVAYLATKNEKVSPFGAVYLPEDVETYLVSEWNWVHTVDPYDGGKDYDTSEDAYRSLDLADDGTFTEISKEQVQEGIWMLNKEKDALALIYGKEQKASVDLRRRIAPHKYRYKLKKLTQDSLILAVQGRHGYVIETYLAGELENESYHTEHDEG